jgi:hypothetical protein
VIDETIIGKLLNETPKQQCSITICSIPTPDPSEFSEDHVFPSNIGGTVSQSNPILSPEESRSRLLSLRDRIVHSGAPLLDEDALQRQIDEIKGRA